MLRSWKRKLAFYCHVTEGVSELSISPAQFVNEARLKGRGALRRESVEL
jgi:hypothetical protein